MLWVNVAGLIEMRIFAKEELGKYDGRDGIVYVAYNDKVYDISKSYHWRRGIHQVVHHAGNDLTDVLPKAPHGADVLDKFPIVGELTDKE